MTVTAESVKQLRERTGAGMMECKKALVESAGDLDAAAEIMRKSGHAKADKKSARIAAEGRIAEAISADGKTAVLISHRFSSVRMADRILVLADGMVEAAGTHDELMAQPGRYSELFELQAAGYR